MPSAPIRMSPRAVEIIQLVGAYGGGIQPVEQTESCQFTDRMRQRVDADAEFADGVGLFEQFAVDAARAQHQRSGKAADAASDDDCLHQLDSNSTRRFCPFPANGGARERKEPAIRPIRLQAALSPRLSARRGF